MVAHILSKVWKSIKRIEQSVQSKGDQYTLIPNTKGKWHKQDNQINASKPS